MYAEPYIWRLFEEMTNTVDILLRQEARPVSIGWGGFLERLGIELPESLREIIKYG